MPELSPLVTLLEVSNLKLSRMSGHLEQVLKMIILASRDVRDGNRIRAAGVRLRSMVRWWHSSDKTEGFDRWLRWRERSVGISELVPIYLTPPRLLLTLSIRVRPGSRSTWEDMSRVQGCRGSSMLVGMACRQVSPVMAST